MGRKALLKNKAKEAMELEKARVIGHIKGEKKGEKHKSLPMKIKDVMENIEITIDPLELVSVIALTPLVHEVVKTSAKVSANTPWWAYAFGVVGIVISQAFPDEELQKKIDEADWYLWLISFGLTYVIIHNFGAILSSGQGIAQMAGLLLA